MLTSFSWVLDYGVAWLVSCCAVLCCCVMSQQHISPDNAWELPWRQCCSDSKNSHSV